MEHMCFPAGLLSRDWGNRNCHWPSVPLPSHLAPLLAPAWVRCTQNSPSGAGLFSNFHLFWLLCFFGVRFTRLWKTPSVSLWLGCAAGGWQAPFRPQSGMLGHLSDWTAAGSRDSWWGHAFPGQVYSHRSYLQVTSILSVLSLRHLHGALASFEVGFHGVNRKATTFLLSLASFAELAFIFSQ